MKDLVQNYVHSAKNANEDEYHFVYVCPVYDDLRKRFLGSFVNVDIKILLNGIFDKMSRSVAQYIFHSFKLRQKLHWDQ